MKSVLCFGDSNTWGANPNGVDSRWPRDVRWPGVLQKLLGDDYYVIEEGYNGRTTVPTDYSDRFRCGIEGIQAVMKTHYPLDMVIMMLGTNDLHFNYATNAKLSADFAGRVIKKLRGWCMETENKIPEILLVSPIQIGKDVENSIFWGFNYNSYKESLEFPKWYSKVAQALNCHFFDAATVAGPGPDQIHIDSDGHRALAEALAVKVREILP